jgi:hypothetical protein
MTLTYCRTKDPSWLGSRLFGGAEDLSLGGFRYISEKISLKEYVSFCHIMIILISFWFSVESKDSLEEV